MPLPAAACIFVYFAVGITSGEGLSNYRIDLATGERVFDGVGGLSAGASSNLLASYDPGTQAVLLDLLFKPQHVASLQILKGVAACQTPSCRDPVLLVPLSPQSKSSRIQTPDLLTLPLCMPQSKSAATDNPQTAPNRHTSTPHQNNQTSVAATNGG